MLKQSWVSARHACRIPAQFQFICDAIKKAVAERNDLSERQDISPSAFRFDHNNCVGTVTRADNNSVAISISDDTTTLEVRGHIDHPIDLALSLGNKHECLLVEIQENGTLYRGTSYHADDIPQLILDRLFFRFWRGRDPSALRG